MLPEEWGKVPPKRKAQLKKRRASRNSRGTTAKQLMEMMRSYRPDSKIRETGKAKILDLKISNTQVPYLIVESEVQGRQLWQQVIHFRDSVLEARPIKGWIKLRAQQSQYWWLRPIQKKETVKLRCTCPDFRHSFSWEDFDVEALSGRRIPYTKVPGSNRPPRNPDHVPGLCKHLRSVIYELQKPGGFKIMSKIPGSFTTSTNGYQWRFLKNK